MPASKMLFCSRCGPAYPAGHDALQHCFVAAVGYNSVTNIVMGSGLLKRLAAFHTTNW